MATIAVHVQYCRLRIIYASPPVDGGLVLVGIAEFANGACKMGFLPFAR